MVSLRKPARVNQVSTTLENVLINVKVIGEDAEVAAGGVSSV